MIKKQQNCKTDMDTTHENFYKVEELKEVFTGSLKKDFSKDFSKSNYVRESSLISWMHAKNCNANDWMNLTDNELSIITIIYK